MKRHDWQLSRAGTRYCDRYCADSDTRWRRSCPGYFGFRSMLPSRAGNCIQPKLKLCPSASPVAETSDLIRMRSEGNPLWTFTVHSVGPWSVFFLLRHVWSQKHNGRRSLTCRMYFSFFLQFLLITEKSSSQTMLLGKNLSSLFAASSS